VFSFSLFVPGSPPLLLPLVEVAFFLNSMYFSHPPFPSGPGDLGKRGLRPVEVIPIPHFPLITVWLGIFFPFQRLASTSPPLTARYSSFSLVHVAVQWVFPFLLIFLPASFYSNNTGPSFIVCPSPPVSEVFLFSLRSSHPLFGHGKLAPGVRLRPRTGSFFLTSLRFYACTFLFPFR